MDSMFRWCSNITSVDLSNFDTSKLSYEYDMYAMFSMCTSLISINLSNFDTSKATNMGGMFAYNSNLTTIKGVIDMRSCTDYAMMFYNCPKLSGVKIKNPPAGFDGAGLSSSQYTIVS